MGMEGSPKKYAQDVATGLHSLNRSTLKRFSVPEVKKIESGIQVVLKELRSLAIESGDIQGLKTKGMKMQRLSGALRVIQQFYKDQRNFRSLKR